MKSRELREKIISKKTRNLLINYVLTVINNKNEVNQNLNSEDINIIIASGNGRKKKIFSSLSIINTKFDPKTYSKKNIDKFSELKNLIEPLDEEGVNPLDEFEEIEFNFIPKLDVGLKFDLNNFDFKTFKEYDEIKTFDKTFLNNNDGKNFFCVYSTKLDEKQHKLKKIIELIDTILNYKEKFFNIYKKVLIIFEVKTIEQIEEQILKLLPLELREVNENENFNDFEILFNIKNENEQNSPSDIFTNNDLGKTFYFILNSENYITQIKSLYYPEHLIEEMIKEKYDLELNLIQNKDDVLDQKIDAFYEFYDFIKNIKQAKYYFYISYHFKLILTYNDIEDKLLIKDIVFTRFNGEFRSKEYNKLNRILSITNPENIDLREIKSIDIDIDFNDMGCIKCSKEIKNNEELFYCYICKHKYCYDCVKEHCQNNTGKSKFIDPKHNLIFFKTRDKNNLCGIEKYKLGSNTFVNSDESELGRFKKVQCNGCAMQFATSIRYICLSCKPGIKRGEGYNDYCQNCIEHMMKNDKKGQDLQREKDYLYNIDIYLLSGDKTFISHNHNNHVYLMVPLASNDTENPYYDY